MLIRWTASWGDICWFSLTNEKTNLQPSRHRLQPHAVLPFINEPCSHVGHFIPTGEVGGKLGIAEGGGAGCFLPRGLVCFLGSGVSQETSVKSNSTRPFGFILRAASNFLLVRLDLNPFSTLVCPLVNSCFTVVLLIFRPDMVWKITNSQLLPVSQLKAFPRNRTAVPHNGQSPMTGLSDSVIMRSGVGGVEEQMDEINCVRLFFTASMKDVRLSFPSAIEESRASHLPVSSAFFSSSTGTALIKFCPLRVDKRFFFFLSM